MQSIRYSAFYIMAPPGSETPNVHNKGAEGADISGSSEYKDPKELTTAEKAALTKLKNAQRVNNLEDNVDDIYQTIRQLSTSVSDIVARQDGFPELISSLISQNLHDILKPAPPQSPPKKGQRWTACGNQRTRGNGGACGCCWPAGNDGGWSLAGLLLRDWLGVTPSDPKRCWSSAWTLDTVVTPAALAGSHPFPVNQCTPVVGSARTELVAKSEEPLDPGQIEHAQFPPPKAPHVSPPLMEEEISQQQGGGNAPWRSSVPR